MTTSTNDELDRNTSGRFVRNLALSLSGGALLTLIGAGAASATGAGDAPAPTDTGTSGTASDGQGTAGTGDATAVGNQSGTNTTQTVTVSGNLGVIQVINQKATVNNNGTAIANTGGNIAIGNASINDASATQNANGGATGAFNNGDASNSSNGGALINTGNASAVGNQSNTNIVQDAHGDVQGTLGSILVINQDATVNNIGVGVANTGYNAAIGNNSGGFEGNQSALGQVADGAGLANNNGKATNNSDGKATINTGAAAATGNKSNTNITQNATGSAGGSMGGLLIIDQDATVNNIGVGIANTGGGAPLQRGLIEPGGENLGNAGDLDAAQVFVPGSYQTAIGNQSNGRANGSQEAEAINPANPDIGIGSNNGEASNTSAGTALINTGDASALGNDSKTTINQNANGQVGTNGASIISQDANVNNIGIAIANTGLNDALGNGSTNDALLTGPDGAQEVTTEGFNDIGVAANFGKAANLSDGTGIVDTGKADAIGSRSDDEINQSALAQGGALDLQVQDSDITNIGISLANSGLNGAAGNLSENDAALSQNAELEPGDGVTDIDTAVMGQFGVASNASDGTAQIYTGDATAIGNDSTTHIDQVIDPTGVTIQTQTATVNNIGLAVANTGGNQAVGNASDNNGNGGYGAEATQNLTIAPVGDLDVDTIVGANNGEASNASDGSAAIWTGDASATGNHSATRIGQVANASIPGEGVVINPQNATVNNGGVALANSGNNLAVGNASQNDAVLDQNIELNGTDVQVGQPTQFPVFDPAEGGVLIASNNGEASNASDGTARIRTGDATATGNYSRTELDQIADATIVGEGVAVNPQTGLVTNTGAAVANSGVNFALGNDSNNSASLEQDVLLGSPEGPNNFFVDNVLTMTNQGTASNASDGTADIETGDAEAVGNTSQTNFLQDASGIIDGEGVVLNVQDGTVTNDGIAVANSGLNESYGNLSSQDPGDDENGDDEGFGAKLVQTAEVNEDGLDLIVHGPLTASNVGTASNASDGHGSVRTGDAQAQGNVSSTIFEQVATGTLGPDAGGIVPNIQTGEVINDGAALANSGLSVAIGNASGAEVTANDVGALFTLLGSINLTAETTRGAIEDRAGDLAGLILTPQPFGGFPGIISGPVLGLGGGDNVANLNQDADIDPEDVNLEVNGPATAYNQGTASNASDGTGKVHTGGALASGNVSTSNFTQRIGGSVTGGGLVVAPQTGLISNEGVGLANSGLNIAVGNASHNEANPLGDFNVPFGEQEAQFDPQVDNLNTNDDPNDPNDARGIDSALTVGNTGEASNTSDGFACVCTGNAWASGNISTSTLLQDMEIGVEDGLSVVPTSGQILNSGFGTANSGLNLAVGNISDNTAGLYQRSDLVQTGDLDGPQTFVNGGGAKNTSNGTGKVGTGNAKATGNQSTSDLTQAAVVDGPGAFAAITGDITNTGNALANAGINLGLGNASVNEAYLDQRAEGEGTVANQGWASNDSDGFGGVGDPYCEDEVEVPETPDTPGVPSLPKTGGPLEVEAAIGLMLLLAGFGLRRASKRLS